MLLQSERIPWWKWPLFSLGAISLTTVALFAAMVSLAFLGVDVQEYLYVLRPTWITSGWVGFWLAFMLMGQSLGLVAAALFFRPARMAAFALARWPVAPRSAVMRILLGAAVAVVIQWVWAQAGPEPVQSFRLVEGLVYAVARGGAPWPWVWLLLATVIVGPLAEEVLYRGLLQSAIRRRWGVRAAMLGSAVLFGLAHGPNAVPTALLGLYLSYQVEQDRSLVGAVILHALHNLVVVMVMAFGG